MRVGNGDFGLIAFDRDAAHNDVLQPWRFLFHDCSSVGVKAASNFERDLELLGKLHGTGLHDLRTGGGHFEKLIKSHDVNFSG